MNNAHHIIRLATADDLSKVEGWLPEEVNGQHGFIHNIQMIREAQAKRKMLVYVASGAPVGFLTEGISLSSILQVKSGCKKKGIGRLLVEHALQQEEKEGKPIQVIQCSPRESTQFWRRVGFNYYQPRIDDRRNENIFMYHTSEKNYDLRSDSEIQSILISVYSSHALHQNSTIIPNKVNHALANIDINECKNSFTLTLDHRIFVVDEPMLEGAVVKIEWSGKTLFFDKAKRSDAEKLGLHASRNSTGWYIDTIECPFPRLNE